MHYDVEVGHWAHREGRERVGRTGDGNVVGDVLETDEDIFRKRNTGKDPSQELVRTVRENQGAEKGEVNGLVRGLPSAHIRLLVDQKVDMQKFKCGGVAKKSEELEWVK